jgi:hypothetical protein
MIRWFFAWLTGFSAAGFIVGQARRLYLVSGLGVIVLFILLLLAFTLLARWVIDRFALPRLERMGYSPRVNALWLAGSLLAGMLLALAIPVALPRYPAAQTLEIVATGEKNPQANGRQVKLRGLYQQFGDRVSFIDFIQQGKWDNLDQRLVSKKTPAALAWRGNSADPYLLVFDTDSASGMAEVVWNGEKQRLDLYTTVPGIRVIYLKSQPGSMVYREWFFGLCSGVFMGLVLYLLSIYLASHQWRETAALHPANAWQTVGHVTAYALPLVTAWGVLLLIFWPGMMSADSLGEWAEALAGQFSDGHPLFHLVNLWLVARVWPSPAAVALLQIIALAWVSGWWFMLLRKYGAPRWVVLLLLCIYALLPISGLLVITIWKDVAYGIAILALSGILLEISMSDGRWLSRRGAWVILGTVAALVALYRYNGLPVALISLGILPLFYRAVWRPALYALLLLALFIWASLGPLYRAFQTTTTGSQQVTTGPAVHLIAAHIYLGTRLSPEQARILGEIRPLDDLWGYRCFSVNQTVFSLRYNPFAAAQYRRYLFYTLLDLTLRNPGVNLKHLACASSLVWRLVPTSNAYLSKHTIVWDSNGAPGYIEDNSLGIDDRSLMPGLLQYYSRLVKSIDSWLIWRPALYLYFCLFGAAVFVLRRRSWRYALFLVPALLQSAGLALVNVAQDFRYQFAIYLVSFFSLGLMFTTRRVGLQERNRTVSDFSITAYSADSGYSKPSSVYSDMADSAAPLEYGDFQ